MSVRRLSVSIVLPLLLSACAVGPAYHAPQTGVAPGWSGPAAPGAVTAAPWWRDLRDPLLDALVGEMLAASPSLREAQARLAEARANRDAVRGGSLPQVNAAAGASQQVLSENGQFPVGQIPGFARAFGLFDLGFDASWEIDLWGRQARRNDAAQARSESAALALEGTRLQLVAELARAYVDLRLAQADCDSAAAMQAARADLARLVRLRADAGESSAIEAGQAAADAQEGRAALAAAQALVRDAAARVAVLVGVAPADMLPRLEAPGAIPLPPVAVAAGLPADLLRRRPDILAAERDLAAATAETGVATADLFPRLSLGLAVGQQARAIADLASGDSGRLQAGPSLLWPIFNGGRARALVRAADARAQGAAARYDAAVVRAFNDSEAAIHRFDRSLAALEAARSAADLQAQALALVRRRVAAGEDDRLALARAQLAHLAAVQRQAQVQAQATAAAIALHKALGGGWQPDPS